MKLHWVQCKKIIWWTLCSTLDVFNSFYFPLSMTILNNQFRIPSLKKSVGIFEDLIIGDKPGDRWVGGGGGARGVQEHLIHW